MQADRRLVEHIHDAGQAGADLRGEPDALRLASRERLRGTVQGQVFEADIVQELQAADDLLDDLVGDRLTLPFELEAAKEFARILERQIAYFVDRSLTDFHMPRFAPQPRAMTLRARLRVEILRKLLAHHHGVRLAITALEIRNDPLEGMLAYRRFATLGQIRESNLFLFAAVEDHLLHMLGQLIEGLLQLEGQMAGEALQQLEVELIAPIPALDRPGRKREVRKDDHALGIEKR